jgi:hypothetical protein
MSHPKQNLIRMNFGSFAICQTMTDKSKCATGLSSNEEQSDILQGVLFSDEATLYVNWEVNTEHTRYWSQKNPNWCSANKEQGAKRLIVQYSISDPSHFNGTAMPESY